MRAIEHVNRQLEWPWWDGRRREEHE